MVDCCENPNPDVRTCSSFEFVETADDDIVSPVLPPASQPPPLPAPREGVIGLGAFDKTKGDPADAASTGAAKVGVKGKIGDEGEEDTGVKG
jgi:hypothetical protein